MTRIRILKLEKMLLKIISNAINYKLRDSHLDMVSINHVKLSNDMGHARIYFSHLDKHSLSDVQQALEKSSGYLKNEIAQAKIMRLIPELSFEFDDTEEKARHLDELFAKLEAEKEPEITPSEK
ncbi:MAG: 30S ribosome-binding factor RbfA [Candidatus Cloacimonetes bacterium]|nr:30S ribosome-binding factor RbfA [Candidatus Cloacimonadota bacterium]